MKSLAQHQAIIINIMISSILNWSRRVEYLSSSQVLDSKSVELNWEVELEHLSRIEKLDLITQFENSIRLDKILDKCK